MLVNTELYLALKEAGVSDERAEAAAAILAQHERRKEAGVSDERAEAAAAILAQHERRFLVGDVILRELRFYGAFIGIGLLAGLISRI